MIWGDDCIDVDIGGRGDVILRFTAGDLDLVRQSGDYDSESGEEESAAGDSVVDEPAAKEPEGNMVRQGRFKQFW